MPYYAETSRSLRLIRLTFRITLMFLVFKKIKFHKFLETCCHLMLNLS